MGTVLMFFGDIAAGRRAMLRSLELDPHAPEMLDSVARLLKKADDGSARNQIGTCCMKVLDGLSADIDGLPETTRIELDFALGIICAGRGEIDRAFAHMAKGNALKRLTLDFDIDEVEQRFEAIAEVFDADLFARLGGAGDPSPQPIFIVGMARSGTTLVEQIVSAHSQVHGAGELRRLPDVVAPMRGRVGEVYPYWAEGLSPADCARIGQSYLNSLPAGRTRQPRITDKWLENFEHLGLIQLCLPRATIIHCRRDPRDVGFSCFALRFSAGQNYAYELEELGRYWRAYGALMDHWRAVLPPGRMLEVPYEALVEDGEAWARRIIAHCGLDWEDACLQASTSPNAPSARPAPPRCANRSSAARSAAGSHSPATLPRCSRPWVWRRMAVN